MTERVYDTNDGEFVDFGTLEEWEANDKRKDARIKKLEAKLAKALVALERSAQEHRVIAGMNMIGASATAYNAAREAEATIKELKGRDK